METLNPTNADMVQRYREDVQANQADAYMLTVARDGETPERSIYFYDNAIDASQAYGKYGDWGFAKEFLTVKMYEPTGKVHQKVLERPRGGECVFLKQDYIKVTASLVKARSGCSKEAYNGLVSDLAMVFSRDNQRFDHIRFFKETGADSDE